VRDLHCGECVLFGWVYWFFFFAFAHLAWAARRAAAFRSSLDILAIRALPPFLPSSTAAGFLRVITTFLSRGNIYRCKAPCNSMKTGSI
jgi:hypothetical protein